MAAIELRLDLSDLIDAVIDGDNTRAISITRDLLEQNRNADILIGRLAMAAINADTDGFVVQTLAAIAMLARFLQARPAPLDTQVPPQTRSLPLFIRAFQIATPTVRAAANTEITTPSGFAPSGLFDSGKTVNDVVNDAVQQGDELMAERALLGLFDTGADYRTLEARAYEAISTTFKNGGDPLLSAYRAFQLLDVIEWATPTPIVLHWLSPRITGKPGAEQPAWSEEVRHYTAEPVHSLAVIRTRLSAPKEESALPLRPLVLSNASTTQVCQGVYDALITGEASPQSVAAVIALAASDLLQQVRDDDRAGFNSVARGLLFASATHNAFHQIQDVEALNLLFTAAAYVNALWKQLAAQAQGSTPPATSTTSSVAGGGLIAVSQLEALEDQLKNKDIRGAHATVQRYLNLGHDPRALFGTIGLIAAENDATLDHGSSLQVIQSIGDEFVHWPRSLRSTSINSFVDAALRTAAFGQRDTLTTQLD
jgi:hypothetical protein